MKVQVGYQHSVAKVFEMIQVGRIIPDLTVDGSEIR